MSPRFWITTGLFIGSTVGSYLPVLWGDSAFSFTSIFLSLIGGLLGAWAGWRMSQYVG